MKDNSGISFVAKNGNSMEHDVFSFSKTIEILALCIMDSPGNKVFNFMFFPVHCKMLFCSDCSADT